jgi:hypothetical protein
MSPKAHLYGCFLQRFHTAIRPVGDHQLVENCETFECAIGIFRPTSGASRGNLKLFNNRFTGLTFAAFAVDVATEEDSLESYSNHWGFSPYGWFAFLGGGQHEFAFTNVTSFNDSFESAGNRHVDFGNRKISGDFYNPKTGALDVTYRLANGSGTFSGVYTTGNGSYVFESGNVTGAAKASNGNLFQINATGGDTSNGPFLAGGSTGVFHTN